MPLIRWPARRDLAANKAAALASFRLIERADPALADEIIDRAFINREAEDDDDTARLLPGPAGFVATARWLNEAFSDLRFEPQETAAEADVVMVAALMRGRHTGFFQGIAPSGRDFAQKQVHVFHLRSRRITEHRAVRDDLGLLLQLGWRPG